MNSAGSNLFFCIVAVADRLLIASSICLILMLGIHGVFILPMITHTASLIVWNILTIQYALSSSRHGENLIIGY